MAHSYSVRPHLLDEADIHQAILATGLESYERSQITEILVERYTVDLDLLALAMLNLASRHDASTPIAKAA